MNRIARRSLALLLVVALMLGGIIFFLVEYFLKADTWVLTGGSPHVYDEPQKKPEGDVKPNIDYGVITDRDGILLLDTNGNRTYSPVLSLRKSTLHWVGDRRGNIAAPAVSTYAEELVGFNPITGLYQYSGSGRAMLTLSSKLQMVAMEALGEHKGTLAVYNYKTGEILCAVTTPTFDPDNVPEDVESYEGIYVNRFTKAQYTPGSIFKIVTTAAALEEIPDIREQTFRCTGSYSFSDGSDPVTCENKHGKLTLADAMAQSCNCAYAAVVEQLGAETLLKYVEKYRVLESVSFDGITTKTGKFDVTDAGKNQIAWSGIGQHKDLINPCTYLTFMGAIANGGAAVQPYVVSQVTCGKDVTYKAQTVTAEPVMPAEIAEELQAMMRNNVEVKYGVENFPDMTVCAKSGTAQSDNKPSNALFAGFVTDEEYPLAFIVVVQEGGYGRHACVPIISEVLTACKEVMDRE